MPLVCCAFTNVFFKCDRTFVLFSKSNNPLFRTWPPGQGSKELCGTGEILSGLCRHQVATKRVLPNAYCVIDADYNDLTIRRTQCVINAKSPNAYCVISNNNLTICCTQCVISAQSPNAYCVIDADYNNLTIHSTQCVVSAQYPNAYCAINAQCSFFFPEREGLNLTLSILQSHLSCIFRYHQCRRLSTQLHKPNAQCAIKAQCHWSGWQKLAAFRRGQKGHKNFCLSRIWYFCDK